VSALITSDSWGGGTYRVLELTESLDSGAGLLDVVVVVVVVVVVDVTVSLPSPAMSSRVQSMNSKGKGVGGRNWPLALGRLSGLSMSIL
jgi:hypothetical protein